MQISNNRLGNFLPFRMAVTSKVAFGLIADECGRQFGMKIHEWRIMAVLGDTGPLSQHELVRATFMHKVAVNRACKALHGHGYLVRSQNTADGRSHRLALSEEGLKVFDVIWQKANATSGQIFSIFTQEEEEKFGELIEKVMISLGNIKTSESVGSLN